MLSSLREQGLLRKVRDRAGAMGRLITIDSAELVNFASNDYLGLASDRRISAAAALMLAEHGAGAGASRLLSGGMEQLHGRLEARLAAFKGTPACVLFNSGYAANTSALPALAVEGDEIYSDALNHASLIDGCRLSRAAVHVYPHLDIEALARMLAASSARRKVIVTDTVFSMTGEIAPLPELNRLALAYGAVLYMDDAHGTGVLGGGRGALGHFGLPHGPHMVQMGTLSKALGGFGAFVACERTPAEWFVNRARGFIYSTALPPAAVASSLAALGLIEAEKGRALIERLWANRQALSEGLHGAGLDTGGSETPIMPVAMRDAAHALSVSARLAEEGFFAPAIRPPTVPSACVRLSVTAMHTPHDISGLCRAIARAV